MNDEGPKPDRLLDEAIDLVIRLQNDPDNPVSLEMIRAWRARGVDHETIWVTVSEAHGMSGKILTDRRRAERRKGLGLTRRNLVIGGAAGLGAAAAGSSLVPDVMIQARADHMTAKGEIRTIRLSDGSVATLGPDSAIALGFAPGRRRVDLLKGMSFFEVAADARRPFTVQTDRMTAVAVGTAFEVSNDAGILVASVGEGVIEVRVSDSVLALGERFVAGDWMSFDPSSQSVDRGKREAGQIAAWRDKLIMAERESISALVARIGRWQPGRIVVADPFIGSQKVSGLFDLNDPLRALEAVVHPAGARVRRISSLLTVISPF